MQVIKPRKCGLTKRNTAVTLGESFFYEAQKVFIMISFQKRISKNLMNGKLGGISIWKQAICSHRYVCMYLTMFSYIASHFDYFNNLVKKVLHFLCESRYYSVTLVNCHHRHHYIGRKRWVLGSGKVLESEIVWGLLLPADFLVLCILESNNGTCVSFYLWAVSLSKLLFGGIQHVKLLILY